MSTVTGRRLCGAVVFTAALGRAKADACHRGQGRRGSRHCRECGSALFRRADQRPDHGHRIALAAGALDAPTGLALKEHIFVASKGDYDEIKDGLPQKHAY